MSVLSCEFAARWPGADSAPRACCCSAARGCGSPTAREEAVATPVPRAAGEALAVRAVPGESAAQVPAEGVIPYDLNSALFSDYADEVSGSSSCRPGTHATYRDDDAFEFPVGTVIAKTFAYPRDARDPSKGQRLIETRILKREPDGWVGLPYIWNDAQTEATLDVAGDTVDVSWIHTDGTTTDQQLHHPQRQPVQGMPQVGRDDDADRPEGAAPEPRLRLSRRDGEPARPLEPRSGRSRVHRRPSERPGLPSGTIPQAARSTTAPAPGSRSTAPTATTPTARRGTPAST